MGQADHQVVLQQALDDDISIDPGQIEVDGQHVEHLQPFLLYEILQDGAQLRLRDVLYPAVLYEFLQDAEEDCLSIQGAALYGQAAHYLVLDDVEEEVELVGFGQELERNDDHLQVVLLPKQILQYFGHFSDLAQFLVDILDGQHLTILCQFLLLSLDAQIEPVGLLMQGDQKYHGALILLLHLQQVGNESPVAVDVDSELFLGHEVDLVGGVLVEEGVGVG